MRPERSTTSRNTSFPSRGAPSRGRRSAASPPRRRRPRAARPLRGPRRCRAVGKRFGAVMAGRVYARWNAGGLNPGPARCSPAPGYLVPLTRPTTVAGRRDPQWSKRRRAGRSRGAHQGGPEGGRAPVNAPPLRRGSDAWLPGRPGWSRRRRTADRRPPPSDLAPHRPPPPPPPTRGDLHDLDLHPARIYAAAEAREGLASRGGPAPRGGWEGAGQPALLLHLLLLHLAASRPRRSRPSSCRGSPCPPATRSRACARRGWPRRSRRCGTRPSPWRRRRGRRTTDPTDTTLDVDIVGVDHARTGEALLELCDLVLEHRLLVLRVVVLRVLGDVAELARSADPVGDLSPPVGPKRLQLLLEGLVALGGEDHVLQREDLRGLVSNNENEAQSAPRGRAW